jgi:hypothetical protein
MKKPCMLSFLTVAVALSVVAAGCGHTGSAMSPQEKAHFGKVGDPVPDAERKFMQQHASATAGPSPGAPAAGQTPPATH